MIPNNKPFQLILDSYDDECYYLYTVLRSLKNYPAIYNDDYINEEGALYATSFALLCERYVYHTTENMGNYIDDYPELLHILSLEMNAVTFEEQLLATKAIIAKDLKTLFPTEKLILLFFSTIFKMGTEEDIIAGDYNLALDFYKNYIN